MLVNVFYCLGEKHLTMHTSLLRLLTEFCGWPTAEGLTILLLVFLLGCSIYLPGLGRWLGRTTTAFGVLGLCFCGSECFL
jgi:hypothetical protein